MRAVFRVDSSISIGSGHLMRCMALAERLREQGAQVKFICRELHGNLIFLAKQKNFFVATLPASSVNLVNTGVRLNCGLQMLSAEDAHETIGVVSREKPDWLILDHYGIDILWEDKLRPHCKNIMVIDDLASRQHNCDVLLDQNFYINGRDRYKTLVPSNCKLLMGPTYALLRQEFKSLRLLYSDKNRALKKVLVFFTLGNDQGETLKAMRGIFIFGKAERVDIVIGSSNSDIDAIQEMCTLNNWGYHCQVDNMASLMADVDLVIGSGGSSNWERCALGIPAIVTILAENQVSIVRALDEAGIVINLGWHNDLDALDYTAALHDLTAFALRSISQSAFRLVDAKGVDRVTDILFSLQNPQLDYEGRFNS